MEFLGKLIKMSLIGEAEVCFDDLGLRCTWCIRQGWGLLVCWWTVQAPTTWIAGGSSPGPGPHILLLFSVYQYL